MIRTLTIIVSDLEMIVANTVTMQGVFSILWRSTVGSLAEAYNSRSQMHLRLGGLELDSVYIISKYP